MIKLYDNSLFAKRLQEVRDNKGLKQKDLVALLHVTPQTVSNWENGHDIPSVETICDIANALNVSLDTLLKDDAISYVSPSLILTNEEEKFVIALRTQPKAVIDTLYYLLKK